MSDCPPELAVQAVGRIEDPETLRAIADNQSAAKDVRRHARGTLEALTSVDDAMRDRGEYAVSEMPGSVLENAFGGVFSGAGSGDFTAVELAQVVAHE